MGKLYHNYTKEQLQYFIDTSDTKKEVMQKIGYKVNSHNIGHIFDKMVEEYQLINLHFRTTNSSDIIGKTFGFQK